MPSYGPRSHSQSAPLHILEPLRYPLSILVRDSVADPEGACRVPWKGKEHWLWGFEGQVGVGNTRKERIFHLPPWTDIKDWEVEEGKEDGFYLVAPPVRGSGGSPEWPSVVPIQYFFLFLKKKNYCIYYDDGDSPVHRGARICVFL